GLAGPGAIRPFVIIGHQTARRIQDDPDVARPRRVVGTLEEDQIARTDLGLLNHLTGLARPLSVGIRLSVPGVDVNTGGVEALHHVADAVPRAAAPPFSPVAAKGVWRSSVQLSRPGEYGRVPGLCRPSLSGEGYLKT